MSSRFPATDRFDASTHFTRRRDPSSNYGRRHRDELDPEEFQQPPQGWDRPVTKYEAPRLRNHQSPEKSEIILVEAERVSLQISHVNSEVTPLSTALHPIHSNMITPWERVKMAASMSQKIGVQEKTGRISTWLETAVPCKPELDSVFDRRGSVKPSFEDEESLWRDLSLQSEEHNQWDSIPAASSNPPQWESSSKTPQWEPFPTPLDISAGYATQRRSASPGRTKFSTQNVEWASHYSSLLIEGHEQPGLASRTQQFAKSAWGEPIFSTDLVDPNAKLPSFILAKPRSRENKALHSRHSAPRSLPNRRSARAGLPSRNTTQGSRQPPVQHSHELDPWDRFALSSRCRESLPEPSEATTESSSFSYGVFNDNAIDNTWRVECQIGVGSFGEVFLGQSLVKGVTPQGVAIKRDRHSESSERLRKEAEAYRLLRDLPYFPRVHYQGMWRGHPVLVMDLLGPSLKQLANHPLRLRLSAVLQMGLQMVDILQGLHARNLVFRDIKPDNFMLGLDCGSINQALATVELNYNAKLFFFDSRQKPSHGCSYQHNVPKEGCLPRVPETPDLYLVDFGLSTQIGNPNHQKTKYALNGPSKRAGTAKYASLAVHLGYEAGPLDDLEAVAYVLVDLLCGALPWDSLITKGCSTRQLWSEIANQFLEYTRSADRSKIPDYNRLRNFLRVCRLSLLPFSAFHIDFNWVLHGLKV
ncbi:hypothetical protein L0F63_003291 [Massospora cicadina]|nr:hypothetical protein L0F63_003291 [Massospora cicadina]